MAEELIEICSCLNAPKVTCLVKAKTGACEQCGGKAQIFSDFYRIGLLGMVKMQQVGVKGEHLVQHFLEPGELPEGQLPIHGRPYLLHPALDWWIQEMNGNDGFRPVRGVIIGNGRVWTAKEERLLWVRRIRDALDQASPAARSELKPMLDVVGDSVLKEAPEEDVRNYVEKFTKSITSGGLMDAGGFLTLILQNVEKLRRLVS